MLVYIFWYFYYSFLVYSFDFLFLTNNSYRAPISFSHYEEH